MNPYSRYEPQAALGSMTLPVEEPGPPAHEMFERALGVLRPLRAVISPCVVKLWLGCRLADFPVLIREDRPPRPMWLIAAGGARCARHPWTTGDERFERSEEPDLSDDVLRSWFRAAVDGQSCSDPGHAVTLFQVTCDGAAARVYDEDALGGTGTAVVETPAGPVDVPITRDGGHAWLGSGAPAALLTPPLTLTVAFDHLALFTNFSVDWSRWSTPGTGEHAALERALRDVVRQGWLPDEDPRSPFVLRP